MVPGSAMTSFPPHTIEEYETTNRFCGRPLPSSPDEPSYFISISKLFYLQIMYKKEVLQSPFFNYTWPPSTQLWSMKFKIVRTTNQEHMPGFAIQTKE